MMYLWMTKQITRAAVRRATLADAEAIARVHVDSWQAAYLGLIPVPILNDLSVERKTMSWRRVLAGHTTPGSRTLVLIADGMVVGFASIGPTRDNDDHPRVVGEVYALYLSPSVWGHGLGGQLFDAALDDLEARRFATVTIWVLEGNPRARRFYELQSFHLDGARRPVPVGPIMLPEVRYRRRL